MQSALDLAQRSKALSLYKHLYKCLRAPIIIGQQKQSELTKQENKPAKNNFHELLRNEFRQSSVSDSRYCMQKNELFFLARAYLTYLTSSNETLALYSKYCRGERSIEESAKIVGLRLPRQYEPPVEKS